MINVDLHIHTTASDGSLTPQEVVKHCVDADSRIISFTDHNTVAGYTHDLYSITDLLIIPGIELSAREDYDKGPRHILGYGISVARMSHLLEKRYPHKEIMTQTAQRQDMLIQKCRAMGLICDDLPVPTRANSYIKPVWEELRRHKQPVPFSGLESPFRLSWEWVSVKGSPLYVNQVETLLDIEDTIDLIHLAGGYAFLAHPCQHYSDLDEAAAYINKCVALGVDGLEVYHSSQTEEQVQFLRTYACAYGLHTCGGTDFHSPQTTHVPLGIGNLNEEHIQSWVRDVTPWNVGKSWFELITSKKEVSDL